MDKSTIDFIINQLRIGTITWPGRKLAFEKSRKKVLEGKYKNGNDKYKFYWQCQNCRDWFSDIKSLEVDHIDEVGSFKGDWNDFIERLYCSIDNLQVLCLKCHLSKTTKNARERWERKVKPD